MSQLFTPQVIVYKPPVRPQVDRPSVILYGAILSDPDKDWQTHLAASLSDLPIAILNPRRDEWDSSWSEDIASPKFKEQVEWEMDYAQVADVIVFYFAPGTLTPVSLLELGMYAGTGKAIVCCPKGFYKRGYVQMVCSRYGIGLLESLDELSQNYTMVSSLHRLAPALRIASRRYPAPSLRCRSFPSPGCIQVRSFAYTPRWQIRTKEMNEEHLKDLKVNQVRLMEDIHYTAQWGTGERWGDKETETGMSRLALSDADKAARDWFVQTTEALGCKVIVDSMGNTFAVRPGIRNDKPPTFVGSHLDTQPSGGKYDGVLGVTAGVEMLRVLADTWTETEYPVGVVNWTNEEGARFPMSMVSSGVWAGSIPLETAHNLREVYPGTATMASELERIGYLGSTPASHEAMPMAAHFELHIEQGPLLEMANKKIGIVTGVQAYKWFTINVKGRDTHTGTTDLKSRADALLTTSKMILHSHRLATANAALASTGILNLKPGSTNTVPGNVSFSLDIRSPKDETVALMQQLIERDFPKIAAGEDVDGSNMGCTPGLPLTVEIVEDFSSPATNFHADCIASVRQSAHHVLSSPTNPNGINLVMEMTSGAGHDSVYASKRCPTSMIFVPCREGVSHNPREFCKEEDCALGAQVLLQSVVRFDRMRDERRVSWKQEPYTL
ncbi:amidase [Plenodomus tracheiphilus IPT5]|uniref:Amidase n=1 Tax=Plenodomus tracheiphilus IPT5 TaxID=1408161 RepID=A0A6A7B9G1_9PLEO|nr:amidase [Plenodomus tracheiphilus IPT5]